MNKFLTTTAIVFASSTAFAEETTVLPHVSISGEIETVIAETAGDKYGATTSLDLDIEAMHGIAFGTMDFAIDSGSNAITLDEYSVGTNVGIASVSFGRQGNIFVEGETGATLLDPALGTSAIVKAHGASVGLGFTDITADVTDIENVQGAYSLGASIFDLAVSADYNLNSEDWILGSRATTDLDNAAIGITTTYGSAAETFAFEADATVFGITGYLAGDADDMAQNVGGSYEMNFAGMALKSGIDYNLDSEVIAPSFTASFAF